MNQFYKKKIYLTCLLLLFWATGFAQVKVTGVVKASDNGQTLPGVTVKIKGTAIGIATDIKGQFSLDVPADGVLTFSFIGYDPQEVNVNGRTVVNVQLVPDSKALNEVVVVGYGTQKKATLTGAVASVTSAQIADRPVTGLTNALEGTMSGVTIISNNGQPGRDEGSINIRGIGTLNNTDPLIVIDGVISDVYDMNNVNPEDVDNISVLKDAASASIYGDRAANGVIVITTKKGEKGTAVITYSDYFGKQKPTDLPDYLPSWQAATLFNQAKINEGGTAVYTPAQIELFKNGTDPTDYPNTNWLGLFYSGSGFEQNHYIGVNGGTDNTQYAASLGYFDQDGITPNTNSQRYTARVNLTTKLNDKLSFHADLSYTFQPFTEPQASYPGVPAFSQVLRQINRISPIIPEYYANGDYGHISDGNPIAWLNSPSFNDQNTYNLQGIMGADWEIVKGLHFEPSLAYKLDQNQNNNFVSSIQYYNPDGSTSGQANISNASDLYSSLTIVTPQAILDYGLTVGDNHFKALAGYSQEFDGYYILQAYRQGFFNNSLSDLNAAPVAGQTGSQDSYQIGLQSYFGRINYDYKGKYLLEGDIRDDGSSRFAPSQRYGLFPGGSAGWRASEEDFFAPLKSVVQELKFRASWGELGNQNIGSEYPYISTVSAGQNYPFDGVVAGGVAPVNGANAAVTWETTKETDLGLDAGFLNNKLTLTADYFIKNTTGILSAIPVAATYGLTAPTVNSSSVQDKGWELSLAYHGKANAFTYNITGNVSFVSNVVTSLGPSASPEINGAFITKVGLPINSFWGYQSIGIFQNQAEVNAHAIQNLGGPTGPGDLIYKDQNGDGVIDGNDKVYLGSNFPKTTFGLNLNAGYKGFDITGFFQGAANVQNMITGAELGQNSNAAGKPTALLLNSWSPTNTNTDFPRLWINYTQNDPGSNPSSFWVRNASYVRLKDLQFGYNFPKSITDKLHIQKLRIYYSGQNILTLTSFYKGVDPEAPAAESGYDYPQVKINSIGLNVTF
jgi:TonB-linked SusC/RagA family outer membrane protein